MKGLVTMELNERQLNPGVNSTISGYYPAGQLLDIVSAAIGDAYDGNNVWYKLKNGAFVWSGAIELMHDCDTLNDPDKDQYLISYRQRHADGRINLDTKEPANQLYFTPLRLPVFEDSIRVNDLIPNTFATAVTQAASNIQQTNTNRKHVFVYVHGFQAFASLKISLLNHFVQNYMAHPQNKIAKVLFMVWPAQGLSRKKADNRALKAGRQFSEHNLFAGFKALSDELKTKGMFLNLIVHSFGHQLLNGMLNANASIPSGIFENVFLMAPDVTHLVANKNGADLRDYYPDNNELVHYNYTGLKNIATNVHVFHDDQDILLYSSTKKFVAKRFLNDAAITHQYRNLGNYGGDKIIPASDLMTGFTFHSVQDLVKRGEPGELLHYPFRPLHEHSQAAIRAARNRDDYNKLKDLDILFHLQLYPNHHRYLFTCKPVVTKVLTLLV